MARDLDWLGRLTYGVDYYHDDVAAFRNRVNPTAGTVTPDNPAISRRQPIPATGVFLNWDVDLTERLAATAGVRYENDDAAGTINQVSGTQAPFVEELPRLDHDAWACSTRPRTGASLRNDRRRLPRAEPGRPGCRQSPSESRRTIPSLDVQPEHA